MESPILSKFQKIKTFLFDVDGVLTDGNILITEEGKLLRKMSVRDGMAMRIALDKGYQICILTGGKSEGVIQRLKKLGIEEIHIGLQHKIETFEDLKHEYDWKVENLLYMGDDVNDYEVLQAVGLATCPSNAAPEIKEISHYISAFEGGQGCVRDVIEKVLRLNDEWFEKS